MASLDDVKKLVKEYETKYRHPDLAAFEFIDNFDLLTKEPVCPPIAARNGVYVILKGSDVIYIGKSSSQNKAIWHRIVDHIYSARPSAWKAEATHFVAWAVPVDSFFEASALEEFLIFKLRETIPYNRVGK